MLPSWLHSDCANTAFVVALYVRLLNWLTADKPYMTCKMMSHNVSNWEEMSEIKVTMKTKSNRSNNEKFCYIPARHGDRWHSRLWTRQWSHTEDDACEQTPAVNRGSFGPCCKRRDDKRRKLERFVWGAGNETFYWAEPMDMWADVGDTEIDAYCKICDQSTKIHL